METIAEIDEAMVRNSLEAANAVREINENIYLPVDQVLEKLDLIKGGSTSDAAVLIFGK